MKRRTRRLAGIGLAAAMKEAVEGLDEKMGYVKVLTDKLVKGVMIESYIEPGRQDVSEHIYGKSITDPCLGWEDSERLLYEIAEGLE